MFYDGRLDVGRKAAGEYLNRCAGAQTESKLFEATPGRSKCGNSVMRKAESMMIVRFVDMNSCDRFHEGGVVEKSGEAR